MSTHSKKKIPQDTNFPALGRLLTWVDRPGNVNTIIKILAGVCVLLILVDFTFDKHRHFEFENLIGFFGFFGFFAFGSIVLASKALRTIIKRPEDYYAPKSIDAEATPAVE